jgi:hypothetical protein
MSEMMQYLPLLNLLNVPAIIALYVRFEVRMAKLEMHKERVENHLGFNQRSSDHGN